MDKLDQQHLSIDSEIYYSSVLCFCKLNNYFQFKQSHVKENAVQNKHNCSCIYIICFQTEVYFAMCQV